MAGYGNLDTKRERGIGQKRWLIHSFIALFVWGFWGLFGNLAARYLDAYSATFWESMGALIVGLFVLVAFLGGKGLSFKPKRGILFSILTGASYTVGLIFFFSALVIAASERSSPSPGGDVHTILIVTGMYPIVATVINYFVFDEPLSRRQLTGMGVAILAITIFATGNV